ncbi:hypothetical protein HY479_03210 [Candidatus Uhrbacteria bacterium]|nr:hypothetical protein [Candidatus Uhrbacteria bacterium]
MARDRDGNRDRDQDGRGRKEFSAGILIADGLAELVENIMEDLGPTGLTLTGMQPLVAALKKVGADNPTVIHGLDLGMRTAIRVGGLHPALREFLIEFSDAYFDKVKALSKDASENQVKQARGQGIDNARGKLREFVKKMAAKKPYAALESLLPRKMRMKHLEWTAWMGRHLPEVHECWMDYREKIESTQRIKNLVSLTVTAADDPFPHPTELGPNPDPKYLEMYRNTRVRMAYLEDLYGSNSLLQAAKDAVLGRDTRATKKAKKQLGNARTELQQYTADKRLELTAKDKEDRPVSIAGIVITAVLSIAALVAFVIMLLRA